jgi:hypothetical protein
MIITIRFVVALISLCCLLLLVDIGVRVSENKRNSLTKQFAVFDLKTNGHTGIMIADRAKDQPIWGKWNLDHGDSVNFFFDGKCVLNIVHEFGGRAETEVFFYDKDGRLSTRWKARENGDFYGRTFFSESGARSEAWLNGQWHAIEIRTNGGKYQEGIVLDGQWRRLLFTNGEPVVAR